jgi:hypothetical protein
MTWIAVAVAGAGLVGSLASSHAQKSAAQDASNAQLQASQAGIAEQQRQFDTVRKLLDPFVTAGHNSLFQQQTLAGMNGGDLQQAAIDQLKQTPGYTSQLKLGENRILANASATGGLRGGNVQAALGMFAPQLLAQTINDQYTRLGGITSIGQNAAVGVGNAGMATGQGISGLLQQGGAAVAGGDLAAGRANASQYGLLTDALGTFQGMGGKFPSFGGLPTPDAVQGQFGNTAVGGSGFGTGLAYGNQDIGAFL